MGQADPAVPLVVMEEVGRRVLRAKVKEGLQAQDPVVRELVAQEPVQEPACSVEEPEVAAI